MANKVLQLIQESGAKWVDFRFTDTKGKEQHVTYPADTIDEDTFEDGKMFDGSSIAGWKGIEASDMILRPDAETGFIDPFFAEPTVVVTCDVIEPSTGQGYERDPRSIARRAEEYLKSTGIGDTAFFGPEPEFFVFDEVKWDIDMSGARHTLIAEEAAWSTSNRLRRLVTLVTVHVLKAVTSQFLQLILHMICVQKCVRVSKTSWAQVV